MSTDCARGDLPPKEYDIHCPLMGGPEYRLNYFKLSCLERQKTGGCVVKDCTHRVPRQVKKKESTVAKKKAVKICSVDGCSEQVFAKGLCKKHYWQERDKHRRRDGVCLECGRQMRIVGRGLCGTCLKRLDKAGTLDDKYPVLNGKAAARAAIKDSSPSEAVSKDWPGPVAGDKPVEQEASEEPISEPETLDPSLFESEEEAKEFRREPIEDPAPPVKGDDDQVVLIFNERDQELLASLKDWAKDDRRTLEAQILAILDKAAANELAVAS